MLPTTLSANRVQLAGDVVLQKLLAILLISVASHQTQQKCTSYCDIVIIYPSSAIISDSGVQHRWLLDGFSPPPCAVVQVLDASTLLASIGSVDRLLRTDAHLLFVLLLADNVDEDSSKDILNKLKPFYMHDLVVLLPDVHNETFNFHIKTLQTNLLQQRVVAFDCCAPSLLLVSRLMTEASTAACSAGLKLTTETSRIQVPKPERLACMRNVGRVECVELVLAGQGDYGFLRGRSRVEAEQFGAEATHYGGVVAGALDAGCVLVFEDRLAKLGMSFGGRGGVSRRGTRRTRPLSWLIGDDVRIHV